MIEIKRTLAYGNKFNILKVNREQLMQDTKEHISHVSQGLNFFADMMRTAGQNHDHSKLENFDMFYKAQKSVGGAMLKWAKFHAYNERHHLYTHAPDDITLIDVFEHLVDCTMAGLSRDGVVKEIRISNELLQKAHQNTIKMLIENTRTI